jgi:hypothetical protein
VDTTIQEFSMYTRTFMAAILLVGAMVAMPVRAAFIDSINPEAIPATPEVSVFYASFDKLGWYYTPTTSYTLTGIYSNFGPTTSSVGVNTITVQIQSDRPVLGGTLLREGMFEADRAIGGLLGASFPQLDLVAGETYFVNYLGLQGMGVNLGTWEYGSLFMPHPADGATTNLGVYYRNEDDDGFAVEVTDVWEYASDFITPVSGAEPILYFEGFAVPEPASLEIAVVALLGLCRAIRRRRR